MNVDTLCGRVDERLLEYAEAIGKTTSDRQRGDAAEYPPEALHHGPTTGITSW